MKKRKKAKGNLRVLAFVILFIVNNLAFCTEEYVSYAMFNNIRERSIGFDFLRTEERVQEITSFLDSNDMVEDYTLYSEYDGVFENKECILSEYMPEVMESYMKNNPVELVGNEAVISQYFVITEDEQEREIDMNAYVGQTIQVTMEQQPWNAEVQKIETKLFEIKIVGVYDNHIAGNENRLYVGKDFLEEVMLFVNDIHEEDFQKGEYLAAGGTRNATVVVKQYAQIDAFCEEFWEVLNDESEVTLMFEDGPITLESPGMLIKRNEVLENSRTIMKIIVIILNFIGMLILTSVLVNVTYQTKAEIRSKYYEIGIMKAIGYKSKEIAKLYSDTYIKTIARELTITLIIGRVGVFFMGKGIKAELDVFANAELGVHGMGVLLIVVVIVVAVLWGFWIEMWNVRKISAVQALKNVE